MDFYGSGLIPQWDMAPWQPPTRARQVVERGATAVALRANVVPRSPATCRVLTAPSSDRTGNRRRAWFASFRCGATVLACSSGGAKVVGVSVERAAAVEIVVSVVSALADCATCSGSETA